MERTVDSEVAFLRRDSKFELEKPYTFRNSSDDLDIPSTNTTHDPHNIRISDLRGREHEFCLERNGFEIIRLHSKLKHLDFYNAQMLPEYFRELEDLLVKRLGARKAKVFRHGVRVQTLLAVNRANSRSSANDTQISQSRQAKRMNMINQRRWHTLASLSSKGTITNRI
jgi:hypothetical protein